MGWLGFGGTNIARMRKRGDAYGLIEVAARSDVQRDYDGKVRDGAAPERLEAFEALADFPSAELAPVVAAGLDDPYLAVRSAAVALADAANVQGAREPLVLAVARWSDPSLEEPREAVVVLLERWRAAGVPERLAVALTQERTEPFDPERDGHALVRLAHVDSRGREPALDAVASALVDCAGDEQLTFEGRERAVLVAEWMGARAVRAVDIALQSPSPAPHVLALAGRLRDNALVERIVPLCEHATPAVRASAARALGEIQDTRAVAALMRMTQDNTHEVRRAALEALDRFGVSGVVFGLASGAAQPLLTEPSATEVRALEQPESSEPDPEAAAESAG